MLGIIRKNLIYHILYPIPLIGYVTYYFLDSREVLDINIATILGSFSYFILLVPAMMSEGHEGKSNGYMFLSTLPVTIREIVAAKFILVLGSAVLYVSYSFFFFTLFESSPEMMAASRALIMMNALICILLSGILYSIVFMLGVQMFLVFIGVILLAFNILGLVAAKTNLIPAVPRGTIPEFFGRLAGINWYLAALIGLAAYYGLMEVAVRIKERRLA